MATYRIKTKANKKKRMGTSSPTKRGGKGRSIREGGGKGMGGRKPTKGGAG